MELNRIAVHGVPRSGTTWIGAIMDSAPEVIYRNQPLFSYALKSFLDENSDLERIDKYFKILATIDDDFMLQKKEKEMGIIPVFQKKQATHIIHKETRYHHILPNLLRKDNSLKIVGIIRNPLGVISSFIKAPKEFRADLEWNIKEEWRFAPKKNMDRQEEFFGYEKWKEVAFLFLQLTEEYPDSFYLLNYSDLIVQTVKEVEKLFLFCDLEVTGQTEKFIQQVSIDNNAYSVFKNKSDDNQWEKELPKFIVDKIKLDPDFRKLNEIFKWI